MKTPFTHLLCIIHIFVRCGECVKQVPVAFILMSGKCKKDYKKVFKVIKCNTSSLKLEKIVIDFEHVLWTAIQRVFPGVIVREWSFHWSQCIWRKIQNIGLASAYNQDNGTHKLCRQFMALPYLPVEHIPAVFECLEVKASTCMLIQLVTYICLNWIEGDPLES